MKYLIHKLGLDSPGLFKSYAAGALWAVLMAVLIYQIGDFKTFAGGLCVAVFLFTLSHIRNTCLEAQLRSSLEHAIDSAIATFEQYQIHVRNSTWVPITIRDIRLRGLPQPKKMRRILHFQYVSPSYSVLNNDPDQMELPPIPPACELPTSFKEQTGLPLTEAQSHVSFSPPPGEFHTIPPESGAVYAMHFIWCKEFLSADISDCLMIVEYQTILGRTKVIAIQSPRQSTEFIQRTLREQIPRMQEQEKKLLEQAASRVRETRGGPRAGEP